jgi:hypothetical protein
VDYAKTPNFGRKDLLIASLHQRSSCPILEGNIFLTKMGAKMKLDATDAAIEELSKMQSHELVIFPTEFISKLSGGIARSIGANTKPFSIKSGNPYEISFIEPAFIATIEIQFSKNVAGAEIELTVNDALNNRNTRRKIKHQTVSDTANFVVNCTSSAVSIYLQPGFFELFARRTLEIKQIRISGFNIKDFEALTNSLDRVIGLKQVTADELSHEKNKLLELQSELQAREITVENLEEQKNSELETLQEELDESQEAVNKSNEALAIIKEEIIRLENRKQVVVEQISTNETTVRNIEGEITKGKEHLRELAIETSEKESRLRELSSNVNLFSEEFSSFSNHGAKQTKVFIGLIIVPLAIIALLTGQLLLGAVDLSVKYVKEPHLDLLTIFVTRIPYLTVCASILAVCYSACHFLLNRISAIFAERLDFAKIGILAKDIASASANNLDYTDHELYDARTFLKIEMLKAYLSGNIGTFIYPKRKAIAQPTNRIQDLGSESNTTESDTSTALRTD